MVKQVHDNQSTLFYSFVMNRENQVSFCKARRWAVWGVLNGNSCIVIHAGIFHLDKVILLGISIWHDLSILDFALVLWDQFP